MQSGFSSNSIFLRRIVWIVDADPSAREVLAGFLQVSGAEVQTGTKLDDMQALPGRSADILLINMALGTESDVAAAIQRLRFGRADGPLVVAITDQLDVDLIVSAVKAGADHVVVKPIDTVRLSDYARNSFAGPRAAPRPDSRPRLTPRERDVLGLVTRGHLNREVAEALGISLRTAETHRLRLMKKLGARNAVDLVKIVMAEGILTDRRVSAPVREAGPGDAIHSRRGESPERS